MIPIKNALQFTRLIEALSKDIVDAHIHYKLYVDLLKAREEHPLVMQQSPAFWGLTLKSHLSSSLLHLSRAYDQQKNALHLNSWLLTIKTNFSFFETENFRERLKENVFVESLAASSRRPDIQTLEQDILLCSPKDELVKLFLLHRHHIIAHTNAWNAADGKSIGSTKPLSFENFEELLSRAITILNRYSNLFEASTYSTNVIGRDDYQYIFKSIEDAVKRSEEEIDRQISHLATGER
jgi:hypothetical protein